MTLCVAWMRNGVPTFASDSRLSFGGAKAPPVDAFVKITGIQCVIYPPGSQTELEQPAAVMPIACLFAGSAINAYAIKEHLAAFLQRLHFIPGYSEPSAKHVFDLAQSVFRKVAGPFRSSLTTKADVKLLLVTRCPMQKEYRAIEMVWASTYQPVFNTVDLAKHPRGYFFGSPKAVVHAQALTQRGIDPLSALIKTIEDNADATVGGEVQVADLQPHGLRMVGVTLPGPEHTAKWCGIDFEDGIRETDGLSLLPSYTTFILS